MPAKRASIVPSMNETPVDTRLNRFAVEKRFARMTNEQDIRGESLVVMNESRMVPDGIPRNRFEGVQGRSRP